MSSRVRPIQVLVVLALINLVAYAARNALFAVYPALTARYRERIRDSLKVAFARAARAGEITARSGPPRAALVQAALFGALVTARAGGTAEAEQMLRGLSAELRRWRC